MVTWWCNIHATSMRAKKRNANRRKPDGLKSGHRVPPRAGSGSNAQSFRKALGDHLRSARRRSRLSVEELADKAKLTPDLLKRVERGEAPDLTLLDLGALAAALGVDVMDLGRRRGQRGA